MPKRTRPNYIQSTLSTLAGACTASALPAIASTPAAKRTGFQLSELFGSPSSRDVTIARQLGVARVIAGMMLSRVRREQYAEGVCFRLHEGHHECFETSELLISPN
jgi:hypothetical protein